MRTLALVAVMVLSGQALGASSATERVDEPSLEQTIADAPGPGPVECQASTPPPSCELRSKGIAAFRKLYEADRPRAIDALNRRFEEIPSPKGGYFPILASVQVKDKSFLPALKIIARTQQENDLGLFASEAARMIETGKCSKLPAPPKLHEICQ